MNYSVCTPFIKNTIGRLRKETLEAVHAENQYLCSTSTQNVTEIVG